MKTDGLGAESWTWTDTRFPLVQNLGSLIFQSGLESRVVTVWEEMRGKGRESGRGACGDATGKPFTLLYNLMTFSLFTRFEKPKL